MNVDASLIERLLALPQRDRSLPELAKELGKPIDEVKAVLEGRPRLPGDHQLVDWKSNLGVQYWQVLPPEPAPKTVADRAFRFVRSQDDESYIRVFIPDDIVDPSGKPAKHIELFPFSDVHWGHRRCDKKNFLLDLKDLDVRPNRFGFLNGDIGENALGDSAGGAAWAEQDILPHQQWEQLEEVFRPRAHKLVQTRPGNHEIRSFNKGQIEPMENLAKRLGIPYFRGPSHMEIVWRGYRWTFFIKHGTGASNTPGGKLNAAGKDRVYNDVRHFLIMGHVHDEMTHKVIRSVRRRTFDDQGKLSDFWVESVKEYKIICPSYLLYSGTYAEEAGYSPGSRNTIMIQLFANGDYHVVSSKRGKSEQII